MKKVFLWVVKFVYKVTGLRALVSFLESFALRYRLRVRMVPVSYKLFLVALGVALGCSWMSAVTLYQEAQDGAKWTFEQPARAETVKQEEQKPLETVEEWRTAEFSAYTASVDETDASPLVMASGKMVYVGAIACPRAMKLGSRVEVRGLGEFVCEDRMNIRYENHFDIFKISKAEALAFGRKSLEYKVIEK